MSTGKQHKDYLLRARRMGGSTTVPADQARQVILDMYSRMSYAAIAKAIDSSHTYARKIAIGEIKRISPERQAAILRARRTMPGGTSHVAILGASRRLRALHALGYTWVRLAEETGYSITGLKSVIYQEWDVIEAHHDRAVQDAYDRLSMVLPVGVTPHEKTAIGAARTRARRNGWPPPLAWDNPDDPHEKHDRAGLAARPRDVADMAVVERILGGDMTLARDANKAEKEEVVARWTGAANDLERLTGWNFPRYSKKPAA